MYAQIANGIGANLALLSVIESWDALRAAEHPHTRTEAAIKFAMAGSLLFSYVPREALEQGVTCNGHVVRLDVQTVGSPLKVEVLN